MTPRTDGTERAQSFREVGVTTLALFTSSGTLICCALPILVVSVAGLGSVVAAFTSNFPFLVALSQNKEWVFAGSALTLAITAWLLWRPGRVCPSDPVQARWYNAVQTRNRRGILF